MMDVWVSGDTVGLAGFCGTVRIEESEWGRYEWYEVMRIHYNAGQGMRRGRG